MLQIQYVGSRVTFWVKAMKRSELQNIWKALLPDFPGFAVRGPLLFMQPIGHTLRGIFLERSIDPRAFYAQLFVQPLCVPAKNIGFNVGWRLSRDRIWNADDLQFLTALGRAVKSEALPFLFPLKTPRDVAQAGKKLNRSADRIVQQAIAFAFARAGDVAEAVAAFDELMSLLDASYPWQSEMEQRAQALKSQLLRDLNGASPTASLGGRNRTQRRIGAVLHKRQVGPTLSLPRESRISLFSFMNRGTYE